MMVNIQTGTTIYNKTVDTYDYTFKKGDISLKGSDAKTLLNLKNIYDDYIYIVNPNDLSTFTVVANHESTVTEQTTTTGVAKEWLREVAQIAKNIDYYIQPPKNPYMGPSVEIHTTDEDDNGKSVPLKINYYKTSVAGLYKAVYTNPEATNVTYEWLDKDARVLQLNKVVDTTDATADYGANYIKNLMQKQ